MQLINAGLLLHEIEGRVELLRTRSRYKISTLKVHKNALHNIETSRMSVVNSINLLKLIKKARLRRKKYDILVRAYPIPPPGVGGPSRS